MTQGLAQEPDAPGRRARGLQARRFPAMVARPVAGCWRHGADDSSRSARTRGKSRGLMTSGDRWWSLDKFSSLVTGPTQKIPELEAVGQQSVHGPEKHSGRGDSRDS